MHFIFTDTIKKLYQTFTGDNERRDLIVKNTKVLKTIYPEVDLYYNFGNSPKEELGKDWEQDQNIYESFVMAHNQLEATILSKKFMSAWNPKR